MNCIIRYNSPIMQVTFIIPLSLCVEYVFSETTPSKVLRWSIMLVTADNNYFLLQVIIVI